MGGRASRQNYETCQAALDKLAFDNKNQIEALEDSLQQCRQSSRIQNQCQLNLFGCILGGVPYIYIMKDEIPVANTNEIVLAQVQYSDFSLCDSVTIGNTIYPIEEVLNNNQSIYRVRLPIEVSNAMSTESELWVHMMLATNTDIYVTNSINISLITDPSASALRACVFS